MTVEATTPLQEQVEKELVKYFHTLDGEQPSALHDLVIGQVEEVLLRVVLQQCRGNQSRAAMCLGINRGTLRKKLIQYDLA